MVNTEAFTSRLEAIMAYHNLSATAFAEAIGVPRSSISHLLSGRNKPSLDFVLKVVKRFPEVDLYWLLNGKGTFPRQKQPLPAQQEGILKVQGTESTPSSPEVEKIVILYTDGSFREYHPS